MASHPGLEAPDHHTTTTIFDCWYDVLFIKCCVGFTSYVTGHTPSKKFNFCPIRPQDICPKVSEIIKISLANVKQAFVLFLFSSGFCLETLPWMPFFPSLFLKAVSWTLTLIEASKACSGFFYDLLNETPLHSWINFGRPFAPGKVHHCYKFSPFVDNGSDHGSLESHSLRNGFITLSRLIHVNYFFCLLFFNFFWSWHVLLCKHASLCQTGFI